MLVTLAFRGQLAQFLSNGFFLPRMILIKSLLGQLNLTCLATSQYFKRLPHETRCQVDWWPQHVGSTPVEASDPGQQILEASDSGSNCINLSRDWKLCKSPQTSSGIMLENRLPVVSLAGLWPLSSLSSVFWTDITFLYISIVYTHIQIYCVKQ